MLYLTTHGVATGVQTIDGKVYGFDAATGVRLTDWQEIG